MSGDETLQDALARVYREFAAVPRPHRLEASPERNGDMLLKTLTAVPLREVPGEVIGPYAGWAMTTVGGAEDYRYFLPRILELAIHDNNWMGTDPEIIAKRLNMAPWTEWSAHQRMAVLAVFDTAFCWAIESHPKVVRSAGDWLCALALLQAPIELRLATWREATNCEAALQLAWFVMMATKDAWTRDSVEGAYWNDVSMPDRKKIGLWLRSDDTTAQLYNWLERAPEDDRWMIEHALLILT